MKRAKDSLCNKVTIPSQDLLHISMQYVQGSTQTYCFFCHIINKQLKVSKMNKCYPLLCHTCLSLQILLRWIFQKCHANWYSPRNFFLLFCCFFPKTMYMRLASNLTIHKEGWPWTESLASISQVLELQACALCPAPRNVLKPICPWNGNK